jgi:hypothetical protein
MVDFVSNPSVGDEKLINEKLFRWDGEKWSAVRQVKPKEVTTLTSLIASSKSYPPGTFIETIGYDNVFDRGYGYWVRLNLVSGSSQTPADRVDARCTNALGEVWEYVDNMGYLNLCALGAKGDDSFDNTEVFAAATASRFKYHKLFSGTYLCTRYTLASDFCLEGVAGDRPVIKLPNNGNSILVFGLNVSNVTVRDLVIDGNRTNQDIGSGNNHRGLYFLGACSNLDVENVTVKNTVDHGLFFSSGNNPEDECGKDSTVRNVIVTNCGSQAHIDAGGAGGSGLVGGEISTHYIGCYGYGNHLNGFKGNATYTGCIAYNNNNGGFETGFGTPSTNQAKWVQCAAIDNGGTGWRNQGQGDQLTWVSCYAKGNGRSGILLLNSVNRAVIDDCWFINNGQRSNNGVDERSDTEGFDGITITGTSSNPDNISIDSCQFDDEQGTKTQEYGIYVRKETPNITIGDNNVFGDSKEQPVFFELDAANSNAKIGKCFGLSTYNNDTEAKTVTSTVGATALTTNIIDTRSLLSATRLRLTLAGDTSGTAGAKDIILQVGGEIETIGTVPQTSQASYYADIEIVRHGSNAYVVYKVFVEGLAPQEGMFTTPASFSSSLTVRSLGRLDNASDSITQRRFTLEQV